jgi:hypothetical protein
MGTLAWGMVSARGCRKDHGEKRKGKLKQSGYTVVKNGIVYSSRVTDMPAAKISFSNSTLTLTISSAGALPALKLPKGSMISAYSSSLENGNAVYRLTSTARQSWTLLY